MRKKIFNSMVLISVYCLLFTAFFSGLVFYRIYRQNVEKNLKTTTRLIVSQYEMDKTSLERLKAQGLRINLIDSDGKVLYDSEKDSSTFENHRERPEIKDALAKGEGKSIRYSKTLNRDTIYHAMKSDDKIIRVAKEVNSVFSIFRIIFPVEILIVVALFLLSLFISKRITENITEPIKLGVYKHQNLYPELDPYLREIDEKNLELEKLYSIEKSQNDTVEAILTKMKEGLVIFDRSLRLVLINDSAINILKPINSKKGSHILELTNESKILDAVNEGFKGKYIKGEIEIDNKIYEYFISPESESLGGVALLLTDKTYEAGLKLKREEFTSNVTHELKTPLTIISGFAELLKSGNVEEEKIKEFGGIIYKQSTNLQRLIDDLLKISKLEANDAVIIEELSLDELGDEVCDDLAIEIKNKNLNLVKDFDRVKAKVNGEMIKEAMMNLLTNAIKYNRDGGEIEFKIAKEDGFALVQISDNGIGIEEELLDRIFERFYVVDNSRSKKISSTGLGLSIVKHIVEAHGGRIEVTSEIGKGSTFTIYLPLEK
ncbi:ATPase/histidine kinase/DNA gyrase B/HSP90 domain protein [Peptoniphilus duerdenii ATCC BAA-1640]|uniref:histidine kinase n=1 Tax=Peptoniphilus duerdenii ATCC BAA-1640 TaxID=862517 RepID=E0NNX8_9FIRM|nr:ATP-binding protein [Peptoniphilus duerdenii]EFM24446.1 ATPase/histidine kinase/DNA gyrase B/HSP90 domain protein [Peptoniphilus duerdenii ATCC BAA-1640]